MSYVDHLRIRLDNRRHGIPSDGWINLMKYDATRIEESRFSGRDHPTALVLQLPICQISERSIRLYLLFCRHFIS